MKDLNLLCDLEDRPEGDGSDPPEVSGRKESERRDRIRGTT